MALERSRQGGLRSALAALTAYGQALDEHALISVTDLRGRITHANDLMCRMSGYTREELLGSEHRMLSSGHHPPEFWAEMWRTISGGDTWRGEVCNRAKDGTLYWVDSTIGPVRGIGGKVSGYIAVRVHVSDRKRAEFALAESEAKFRALAEQTGVIVWEYDMAKRAMTYVSPQAASLGYPLERYYEPDFWASILHPEDREKTVSLRANGIRERRDHRMQYRVVLADGSFRWLDESTSVSVTGEKLTKLRGVSMDITEAHRHREELAQARDAAEAASRAKSEFLANMSHEIRTPMTAILGYADLLRDDGDSDRAPKRRLEIIDTISRAGAHLMRVIDDILDLSKIEANRVTVEQIETPLFQRLADVKSFVAQRAAEKGVAVELRFDTPVPEGILSDPTRLRQILINLAGNAVKFTEQGAATIVARVEPRDGQDRLLIDVEDTGRGLSSVEQQQLFSAFSQADTTMARRFGGTGLGLTISRRLARLMGGDLSLAWSRLGHGSCFRLDLPLNPIAGTGAPVLLEASTRSAGAVASTAPVSLHGRILVAEDGADNRRLIAFHLEKAGAEVSVADDGAIAYELIVEAELAGAPFDLLVTDMQMPEMDGYTLVRTLRGRASTLSIIALTAHALAGDREACLEAGCDDYIAKPIDKAMLLATCANWIRRGSA